jgi:signal transduction histidine kinase
MHRKVKILLFIVSFLTIAFIQLVWQTKPYFIYNTLDTDKVKNEIEHCYTEQLSTEKKLLQSENPWLIKDLSNKEMSFVLSENDSIYFWNDSKIEFEKLKSIKVNGVYRLAGRVYYIKVSKKSSKILYALLLLKNDFEFENSFLENRSGNGISLPKNYTPSNRATDIDLVFEISGKSQIIYFEKTSTDSYSTTLSFFAILFYLISVSLLLILIIRFVLSVQKWKIAYKTIALISIVSLIRIFLVNQDNLPFSTEFNLFTPFDFANNWIPSLGMLIVNLVWLIITLTSLIVLWKTYRVKVSLSILIISQYVIVATLISTVYFIENIIINSTSNFINFDGVIMRYQDIILMILFGIIFYLITSLQRLMLENFTPKTKSFSNIALLLAVFFPITLILLFVRIELIVIPFMLLLSALLAKLQLKRYISQQAYNLSLVLVLSVFLLFTLNVFSRNKELNNRQLYLDNYQTDTNRLAEYLLKQLDKKILKDSLLLNLIYRMPETEEHVYKHIKEQFLNGYWSQYQSEIKICGSSVGFKEANSIESCENFFSEKLNTSSKKIDNTHFISVKVFGVDNYLSKYEFSIKDSVLIDLYIFLKPKEQHKNLGYPSILVTKEVDRTNEEIYYSFAKYVDNHIVAHSGSYNYSSVFNPKIQNKERYFIKDGNYVHLVQQDERANYIITAENQTLWDYLIILSYLFILFLTIIYTIDFAQLVSKGHWYETLTLKDKLRISFMGLLILTFIVLAIAIIVRSASLSKQNQENVLNEKMQSVLVELKHKLGKDDGINQLESSYLNYLLIKFSNVFFTDINLFDLQGKIVASSRPEVFEKGLVGSRMDPNAYLKLNEYNKSEFVQTEYIGKLEYLSAYIPFKDTQNRTIAYLNLPYFAKDKEIKKEITTLVTAFLNLFVLLFLITGVFTVFLANRISLPLAFLQQKLKDFSLEHKSEPIIYKANDEIGALVDEYNKTVEALNENMALLAQKEREGAWKEMAKQIAHEIKNPLTPMKLSLQHLKYIWNDNRDDKEEKMYATIDLLVKQIDHLADIASAFSNFSKMTTANQTQFDVLRLLKDQVDLFSIKAIISIEKNDSEMFEIYADERQVGRVVQNLLSNAIQSVPENTKAKIDIKLEHKTPYVEVSICDNGAGMDEQTQAHLFEPNFTTKSSGMGLGLAIVKQIIENNAGEITFKTHINKGSCFMFKLPTHLI